MIVRSIFEELQLLAMPVLKRADRRTPFQHGLGELAVIEADVGVGTEVLG